VQELTPLALDSEMALSDTPTLVLPVVRPVLFSGEVPLLSFKAVAFLREDLRCSMTLTCRAH